MTKDEALDLALEALLRSKRAVSEDLDLASCAYGSNDPDGHRYTDAKKALSTLKQAITAIKQARSAPVQEPVDSVQAIGNLMFALTTWKATTSKTAPAAWKKLLQACADMVATEQPAPVQSCYCPNCEAMSKELAALKEHLTEEKKVELATNWFAEDWAITKAVGMLHDYDRLLRSATPPAAQRKPLTDELLRKMHHEDEFGLFCDYDEFEQIARAIEAKFKEKNNG